MGKHFNQGNVWGRVIDIKNYETHRNQKKFLGLHIDCTGPKGNVHAYGRLWKKDLISNLKQHLKSDPNDMIRFKGFFSQYIDGQLLTNFSFYHWQPNQTNQTPRAAFILVGEVKGTGSEDDGTGSLDLHIVRRGKDDYPDTKEDLKLFTFEPSLVEGFEVGSTWQVKGFLQQGEGEDEFGMASGPVKPFIINAREVK